VVVGVLTALAADESVEWLNWRGQVHAAEDAMRAELRGDDGPQAVARASIETCLSHQLDVIQTAVEAGEDRAAIHALAEAYSPPRRTWDEEAWRVAGSSQVAAHMPGSVMLTWSQPYLVVPALGALNDKEQLDVATLRAGRRNPGPASEAEAERWLVAIENLRHANEGIAYGALTLLEAAKAAGAGVSKRSEQGVLAEMKGKYDSCVTAPQPLRIDFNSQLNPAGHG